MGFFLVTLGSLVVDRMMAPKPAPALTGSP